MMTPIQFQKPTAINSSDLFVNTGSLFTFGSIHHQTFYYLLNKKIPNTSEISQVNVEQAHTKFLDSFSNIITNSHHTRIQLDHKKKELAFDDIYYCFGEDGIIVFDHNRSNVNIYFRDTEYNLILLIEQLVLSCKENYLDSKLGLITANKNGLDITNFTIDHVETDLHLNYNDDLLTIHETILSRLKKDKDKGLVLLYGVPGTGKTTYIRHLISQINKKVLFISPQIAEELHSPQLLDLLINNQNSILVIEDAEKILTSRENEKNSAVTTLLNLTDGLLSDCLNIQIICSFNTDISRIDSALLRKGRLIAKYDFKALETQKANSLAAHLGLDARFTEPTKLTDIYNQTEQSFEYTSPKKAVGF